MQTTRSHHLLAAGLVACLFTSCASLQVRSWSDPEFEGRPLGKTVVLGVAKTDSVRHRYEDLFTTRLMEVGADAVASYSLLPDKGKLSEDKVREAVRTAGADSVIVTWVVEEKDKQHYEPPVRYGDFYSYYSHGYTISSGYSHQYTETHLESNIYDVESGKLVWTGQMVVTDHKSDKKNIKDVVAAQINNWRKAGMIVETGSE